MRRFERAASRITGTWIRVFVDTTTKPPPSRPLGIGLAAPGSLLTTLAVIAALATITTSIGGLYWLGGAMAVATSAGLIDSWVLLVEIKR